MIRQATRPADIQLVREIFLEYAASLEVDLCFQSFDQELATLPGDYIPPLGALLLAEDASGQSMGCAALRPTAESGVGEMKRLYVRPSARGTGTGRALATSIVDLAREAGYVSLRLDTLPSMSAAISLYERLGFVDIGAYCFNPVEGVRYLELRLA